MDVIKVAAELVGSDALSLNVHGQAAWVRPGELGDYRFCTGDKAFVEAGVLGRSVAPMKGRGKA